MRRFTQIILLNLKILNETVSYMKRPFLAHQTLETIGCPEIELLLCCGRTHLNSKKRARVRALAQEDLNWEQLIEMALRHGIMPLLYSNLRATCSDLVPEKYMERLAELFRSNTARNIFLTSELLKILNILEVNGIPAIPYKGPALAVQLYNDLRLRRFVDLDVLIRQRDMGPAKDLLILQGYKPKLQMNQTQERALFRSECDQVFTKHDNKVMLEVHWAITPPFFSFSFETEQILKRQIKIDLAGAKVAAPAPEDLLLILCVNGTKDMWGRLELICGVAELLRDNPRMNWQQVLDQARESGGERMLLLGLFLAHSLLEVELPKEVSQKIEAAKVIQSLAAEVCTALFEGAGEHLGLIRLTLFRLRAKEHLRDNIRYCLLRAITPTHKDLVLLPLPALLFPLYYLLRPLRLIGELSLIPFKRLLFIRKSHAI